MGWENYHLHQFIVGTILYGEPDPEFGLEMKDDRHVQLQRIAHEEGTSFIYEYDFGDGWRHVITVERVEPWTQNLLRTTLSGWSTRVPSRGLWWHWGYEHLLTTLRDPRHPEHKEMRAWAGSQFDPELFSLQAVNSALANL